MDTVTVEDLRALLSASDDTAMVVEAGRARLVDDVAETDGFVVMTRADLLTMLDGEGADSSPETLEMVASSLDSAVRAQGG